MVLVYHFNPYSEEMVKRIACEKEPFHPPHLLLEVFYTPAYANPQNAGWAVMQMGTRAWLSVGHKTREEAIQEAVRRAKQMIPHGVVFERVRGQANPNDVKKEMM
jgi:hypothetical protein